ncbi:hypothetical protein [Streptomyces mirabilis]|uniref:hypothetical protein n=1 Tax=Streptomyces mirabilis TaxID=68239 RepID=UPI00369192E1
MTTRTRSRRPWPGFTGTARYPRALAIRLPDGRIALSQRLTTALATLIAPYLVPQSGRAYTQGGDAYTPVSGEAVVEVVAGTTRHAVVTVVRLALTRPQASARLHVGLLGLFRPAHRTPDHRDRAESQRPDWVIRHGGGRCCLTSIHLPVFTPMTGPATSDSCPGQLR